MKHLPKHLRPRWRYLAVALETWPDADFDRGDFQRECWHAARALLGDPGSAAIDLSVVRFDLHAPTGEALVRVRRDEVDRARAALACVCTVEGDPVGLRIRGASGTIRACEEKYLGGGTEPTQERTVVFERQERTAVVRSPRADVRAGSAYVGATESDLD